MYVLGTYVRDVMKLNMDARNFRIFAPDETASNRLQAVFEVTGRRFLDEQLPGIDDHLDPDGRVMDSMLSEHFCEGFLEGYLLTGRHGFFDSYEAFIRIVDSMFAQHAKWLKMCSELPWRQDIASLNYILASNVWQQDHNGFTHQDPGFLDHAANKKADVVRMYLPPDANCLLSCFDHCIKSRNYVNIIVASKHPRPQWLTMEQAVKHCSQGIGIWSWASNDQGQEPDVVMACCGDTPTLETLAAVSILRRELPELKSSNFNIRSFGERVALNTPIQGTAADIIKLAMLRVDAVLKKQKLKARLVLQVHDELIVECPVKEAEQVKKIVTAEMENVVQLRVPLLAEAKVGASWYEAK